jgi:hypothetical protein
MNAKTTRTAAVTVTLALASVSHHATAQDAADLAKNFSNPAASPISVPFQYNYDSDIGDF